MPKPSAEKIQQLSNQIKSNLESFIKASNECIDARINKEKEKSKRSKQFERFDRYKYSTLKKEVATKEAALNNASNQLLIGLSIVCDEFDENELIQLFSSLGDNLFYFLNHSLDCSRKNLISLVNLCEESKIGTVISALRSVSPHFVFVLYQGDLPFISQNRRALLLKEVMIGQSVSNIPELFFKVMNDINSTDAQRETNYTLLRDELPKYVKTPFDASLVNACLTPPQRHEMFERLRESISALSLETCLDVRYLVWPLNDEDTKIALSLANLKLEQLIPDGLNLILQDYQNQGLFSTSKTTDILDAFPNWQDLIKTASDLETLLFGPHGGRRELQFNDSVISPESARVVLNRLQPRIKNLNLDTGQWLNLLERTKFVAKNMVKVITECCFADIASSVKNLSDINNLAPYLNKEQFDELCNTHLGSFEELRLLLSASKLSLTSEMMTTPVRNALYELGSQSLDDFCLVCSRLPASGEARGLYNSLKYLVLVYLQNEADLNRVLQVLLPRLSPRDAFEAKDFLTSKRGGNLLKIIEFASSEELPFILSASQDPLKCLLTTPKIAFDLVKACSTRNIEILLGSKVITDSLISMAKQSANDFAAVFSLLPEGKRQDVLNELQPSLPGLIRTQQDFLNVNRFLTGEQSLALSNAIDPKHLPQIAPKRTSVFALFFGGTVATGTTPSAKTTAKPHNAQLYPSS